MLPGHLKKYGLLINFFTSRNKTILLKNDWNRADNEIFSRENVPITLHILHNLAQLRKCF